MTVNFSVGNNWLTTLGGILAGLPALVLAAAMTSHLTLSSTWTFILAIMNGVGVLLIGLAAKDYNTHSTAAQVQTVTAEVAAGKAPKA